METLTVEERRTQRRREWVRRNYRESRNAVLDHYGRECACCGSTEDLQIDHVDPKLGAEHRAANIRSWNLYRWLVANGFPPGFQILCLTCNRSKWGGTRCERHPLLSQVLTEVELLSSSDCRSLLFFMADKAPISLAASLAAWRKATKEGP